MLDNALQVAKDISGTIGSELLDALPEPHNISAKGDRDEAGIDLVTEMDEKAEQFITEELAKAFPDHGYIAEEGTEKQVDATYRWVIDPLDGTSNYAHAFPFFAVSLALEKKRSESVSTDQRDYETVLGVVRIPSTDETFHAISGDGAFRDGEPINVSERSPLGSCMVATGFPYSRRTTDLPIYRDFENFTRSTRSIRRVGTASIDLCYLAAGIFDGFWEWHLAPWDTAAGALIIREAGGQTSTFDGQPHDPYGDKTLASNGFIHDEMVEVLTTGEPIIPT